jgi:hypothetical protein
MVLSFALTNEYLIGKDVERNGNYLISDTTRRMYEETEENHEASQTRQQVSVFRLELETSRMQNLISNSTTDIFVVIKMQEVLNKQEKYTWFCADFTPAPSIQNSKSVMH